MKASERYTDKIIDVDGLAAQCARWRLKGSRIVFTNGCFDILHEGHLELLAKAAAMGDVLVVGLNSDASVSRLKGPERPVNDEGFRSRLLASLSVVDAVCVFHEDTPLELISIAVPDVLAKGGDYDPDAIVGADIVRDAGGEVVVVPLLEGRSTSRTIEKIRGAG